MTRWFRSYWAEEDTWFYFEVGADGWVTRQVELQGPGEEPVAAAALATSEAAQQTGLRDYEATFGATAQSTVHQWQGHVPQDLSADQSETVWNTAREACRTRGRE